MKNKSFFGIILVSLIVFIGLLFSVYKIVSKDDMVFYTDGYVSISDSETSEKIYFTSGTTYKRGYGKEVIFKDASNIKQEVGKYNFVFYDNKSINFLTNGVILDLDKVNETFVPYYNVKSNYLIEYISGKYVIKTQDKDIIFDNFIGRINDQKYIVAGNDLRLKLSSSEDYVNDYYFELHFIDGQTVKIDGSEVNVETISEECFIMVGDDVKIDLSNQVIFYEDEAIVNLDEIIVEHNENIDIIYTGEDLDNIELPGGSGGNGTGEGDGTGDGTGSGGSGGAGGSGGSGTGEGDGTGDGTGSGGSGGAGGSGGSGTGEGDGTGDGTGSGGSGGGSSEPEYKVETVIEYKNIPYVELLNSNVNTHKIALDFNVIDQNNLITGPVKVTYVDLNTGDSYVREYSNYSGTIKFIADGLRSETNYLVTISASYIRNDAIYNNYIMFQRTFSTKDLGITLEKDYVSHDTIAYNIKLSDKLSFTGATLNLYDSKGRLVDTYNFENKGQDINVAFWLLNSNEKYTAKIENLVVGNVIYTTGYAAISEQKTLKHNPFKDGGVVASPIATVNKKDYVFKFDLGEIVDKNSSITGVIYNVYEKDSNRLVKTIRREGTLPFEVKIDEDIKDHTTYYYKAIISLNDNEKKIDYETMASNDFNMDTKISPTMHFQGITTATMIDGYFTITDPDNTVDIKKEVYVEYANSLGVTLRKDLVYTTCPNSVSETTKCVELKIDNLLSDDSYTINLFGYVDVNDELILPGITQIGAIKVNTAHADTIITHMNAVELDEVEALNKVFELNINFTLSEGTDEVIKDSMSGFDIMLYEGIEATGLYLGTLHIGEETNIAEAFFDNTKTITIADFGLTLQNIIDIHLADGSKIPQRYSIKLTNGVGETDYIEFKPAILNFEIHETLLGLSDDNGTINVEQIVNSTKEETDCFGKNDCDETQDYYENNLDGATTIGLKVIPGFENKHYTRKINFVIKDITDPLNITTLEKSFDVELEKDDINPEYEFMFKDYPEFFRRGRVYTVEYTFELDLNDDNITDLVYPLLDTDTTQADPVRSGEIVVNKQAPSMILFPWKSDVSLTDGGVVYYKYEVTDIDKALPTDYKIYYDVLGNVREAASVANCGSVVTGYATNYSCMKFVGLNKADEYTIYLDPILVERENELPTRTDLNTFAFEGIYDLSQIHYELEINPDNSQKYNNLLSIKITDPYDALSDEDKLLAKPLKNRIAYYTLTLSFVDGTNTHSLIIDNITDGTITSSFNIIKYLINGVENLSWNNKDIADNGINRVAYVGTCDDSISTCLYVDYSKLYNSKRFGDVFNKFKGKDISVAINAMYDTGKIKYQADASSKKYAFQVYPGTDKIAEGQYLIINGNTAVNNFVFSPSTLSAAYAYINSKYGFVDDNIDDMTIGYGRLGLYNMVYSNLSTQTETIGFDINYVVTNRGIEVGFGPANNMVIVPIIPKELAPSGDVAVGNFSFEQVIPSINASETTPTINGVKVGLGLSGIKDSDIDIESEVQNLYLEVYNAEDALVKTIKINKNHLTSQTGVSSDNAFVIDYTDDYMIDVNSVIVAGTTISNYSFDYKTGKIIFGDEVADGTTVTVKYSIIIDRLNAETTNYLKARMKMNGKDVYLAETTSTMYETFAHEFTTKSPGEIKVGIVDNKLDVESLADYKTRYLLTNFTIDDIVGIDSISYKICNIEDSSLCVDVTKEVSYSCDGAYNRYGNTCFTKNKSYNGLIKHDISIQENFDWVFNTNYNIEVTVNVTGLNGNKSSYIVYDNKASLRALVEPKIKVIRNARMAGTIPYLTFDITFDDPDRVVTNGDYNVYLIEGTRDKVAGSDKTFKITKNGADQTGSVVYNDLEPETGYNLAINYKPYLNNKGNVINETRDNKYLIYTLSTQGVALGRYQYLAEGSTTILKFGYATNFIQDDTIDENNELIQDAYVAGILYYIYITDGSALPLYSDTLIFNSQNYIETKNSDGNDYVGSTYYQITIPGTNYQPETSYDIAFKFYLGGKIASSLTTESLCKDNSISNYWDAEANKCYILQDGNDYEASTIAGNGAAK